MLTSTKIALWLAIKDYMKANGHNMQSIKSVNPFPCSSRWISSLLASIKNEDATNFNKTVCTDMMKFLGIKYRFDGGVLVCEN